MLRSSKAYAELVGNRKAGAVNADDVCGGACAMLSLFIRDPQFQGQTKEKLVSVPATKLVETSIKDHFRSEEHTSELQSLMRISYAVFCLKKKNDKMNNDRNINL